MGQREARENAAAAVKDLAAPSEEKSPPLVGSEKAVAPTPVRAVAANRNTRHAAAWGGATAQLPPASTATPRSAPHTTTASRQPTCPPTHRESYRTTPWWSWWYHSTHTLPWQPHTRSLTHSSCPQPPCTRLYPHLHLPRRGDLLAPRPHVTWAPYPRNLPRPASLSTWPWATLASFLWMSCSVSVLCKMTIHVKLVYGSHILKGSGGSCLRLQGPIEIGALD